MNSLSRNYLVIGSEGGLGKSVTAAMEAANYAYTGLDLPEIDFRVKGTLRPAVEAKWLASGPFDGLVFAAGMFPAMLAAETSEDQFDELIARLQLMSLAGLEKRVATWPGSFISREGGW